MKKLLLLAEYVHYRIYKFFHSRGDNIPEFKATLLLSTMQAITLVDIDVFVELFFNYTFFSSKFIVLIPGVIFVGFNWYRYERNFDINQLDAKWKDEEHGKKVRNGWLMGLYLLISFLIPPVYGYLKHNLKLIEDI